MRAVDTNVLVRLLTRDEPKQAAVADAFVQHGAWVSVLALAEAMWVLVAVYERDAAQVARRSDAPEPPAPHAPGTGCGGGGA